MPFLSFIFLPAILLVSLADSMQSAGKFRLLTAAQPDTTIQSQLQENLEEVLEYVDPEDAGGNAEQLTQLLQELAAHPVNVNLAGQEDLVQVPGINLKLAHAIRHYREQERLFETVTDLINVPGIGKTTLEMIRPYVTVGQGTSLGKLLYLDRRYWTNEGRFHFYTRYQQDLQPSLGYQISPEKGGYLGGPGKYYQRTGYRSRHLSLNLTQEKDAGEAFHPPVKMDHNTWHMAFRDNGPMQMILAGDYSLSFGQGLVLWNGGMFGKGSDVTGAVNRNGGGVRPYTSARENGFFRGVAATAGNIFQVSGFYSDQRRSASVISSDTVRYPRSDGYHRTTTEKQQAGNLRQHLWGGNIQVKLPFAVVGATGYQTVFNHHLMPGNGAHARYDFKGNMNSVAGVDYKLLIGPAILFGETARSWNGGYGFISGLESSLGEDTEMTVAYRNYQKEFQSMLGRGFSEISGNPQNEEGLYAGLKHNIGKRISVSAYMDQYSFPGPRFRLNRPSRGYEWLTKVKVDLTPEVEVYLQVRSETKGAEFERQDLFGRTRRLLDDSRRSSIRGHLQYQTNNKVRLRTRGELVQSKSPKTSGEMGYLIYQDIRLLLSAPLTLDMRVTMFETDSYASRLYQYENDLLYVFSSQALYNRGQRIYLLLHYKPAQFIEWWAKMGLTVYEDQQVIGTGLNQVPGGLQTEVGIQARVRL